uniref:SFRICE_030124 n=1 Tax=Spodoptera frugiperda TaxID=7108 RepID=A0A2H1VTT0_SPOFR
MGLPHSNLQLHPQDCTVGATHILKVFSEDDMTPDFRELLVSQDTQDPDVKMQTQATDEKTNITDETTMLDDTTSNTTEKLVLANVSVAVHQASEEVLPQDKKIPNPNEEVDVVDREDHVTQYLSDLLVNTDSEITSLQATETEDDREGLRKPCEAKAPGDEENKV